MRRLAIACALACALTASAGAALRQSAPVTQLMPSVSYQRQVTFTPRGPVVLNVVTGPRPGGLYSLKPVLSNNALIGRAKLTDMEKGVSTQATAVGVNGDLFTLATGIPSGVLMRSGVLDSPPLAKRSSVGIGSDGSLHVDRIAYSGYWRGSGQRRNVLLNQPATTQGVTTLYTSAFGPTTPAETVSVLETTLVAVPGERSEHRSRRHRDLDGAERRRADPARRRGARRARRADDVPHRRGARRQPGHRAPDADAELGRDRRCDRRRSACSSATARPCSAPTSSSRRTRWRPAARAPRWASSPTAASCSSPSTAARRATASA